MQTPGGSLRRPALRIDRGNLRTLLILAGCAVGDPSRASLSLAAGLLLPGAALHLWSKGCLHQNRQLATGGPYRFTRNPFYLANLLVDLGLCAVIGRWWLAPPYLCIWAAVYGRTVRREEQRLETLFPDDWRRYRDRVPRWLPRLRPAPPTGPAFRWSNPNLRQGREYARLVGIPLAAGLILAAARLRERGWTALAEADPRLLGLLLLLLGLWALQVALGARARRVRP
jgi:hypothetical protein